MKKDFIFYFQLVDSYLDSYLCSSLKNSILKDKKKKIITTSQYRAHNAL